MVTGFFSYATDKERLEKPRQWSNTMQTDVLALREYMAENISSKMWSRALFLKVATLL
ncbi:MAG: hypothetical protein ACI4RS_03350 [Monoglobaceae bacterium]